ncbi:MAG: hypothetical protein KIH08_05825 [Candidatus Freyarchaeota archaeon]|nr:hypothetical protein [Candidatus Jordarchaeia archaeon]MBS7269198.1 hypothetical protein [Candidatus Jordarchaeia archaeon]MBS7279559.1 hypothetical protein [Candidatus Jordarchaeia archaeon]
MAEHAPLSILRIRHNTNCSRKMGGTPARNLHDVAWLMDQYYLARYLKVKARGVITPMELYSEKDVEEELSGAEKTLKTVSEFI